MSPHWTSAIRDYSALHPHQSLRCVKCKHFRLSLREGEPSYCYITRWKVDAYSRCHLNESATAEVDRGEP